jgi:Fic family protein
VKELSLPLLPLRVSLESISVYRALNRANKMLAELKGYAETIPNQHMLINAVMLNEAKDSTAIENIVTTHDELFQAMAINQHVHSSTKEVVNYRSAIWHGYQIVQQKELLTVNTMIEVQQIIEQNRAGIRRLPGTVLKHDLTGEVVYTPPTGEREIRNLLANLETFIHDDSDGLDPLIKLAVIHYQFEAIHPFYDGNGRTGRILNVLYLVLKKLLNSPILYLSRFIIEHKQGYYQGLNDIHHKQTWENWLLYMLEAIEQTADETLTIVKKINNALAGAIEICRRERPKLYSKELIELMFFEVYTRQSHVERELGVERKTAAKYLNELEAIGLLASRKVGRERIYLNRALEQILKM